MARSHAEAELTLAAALDALDGPDEQLAQALDELPAPIYVTDRDGVITHYNRACIDFAGRVPTAGEDRWCVTWKLLTEAGEHLPHDQCPMAIAIREGRQVRGVRAIAERPDGSRRIFQPYPTPLFDADGALTGAVNLLLDLSADAQVADLEQQAQRCRQLAASIFDQRTSETLRLMAAQYESAARRLREAG